MEQTRVISDIGAERETVTGEAHGYGAVGDDVDGVVVGVGSDMYAWGRFLPSLLSRGPDFILFDSGSMPVCSLSSRAGLVVARWSRIMVRNRWSIPCPSAKRVGLGRGSVPVAGLPRSEILECSIPHWYPDLMPCAPRSGVREGIGSLNNCVGSFQSRHSANCPFQDVLLPMVLVTDRCSVVGVRCTIYGVCDGSSHTSRGHTVRESHLTAGTVPYPGYDGTPRGCSRSWRSGHLPLAGMSPVGWVWRKRRFGIFAAMPARTFLWVPGSQYVSCVEPKPAAFDFARRPLTRCGQAGGRLMGSVRTVRAILKENEVGVRRYFMDPVLQRRFPIMVCPCGKLLR